MSKSTSQQRGLYQWKHRHVHVDVVDDVVAAAVGAVVVAATLVAAADFASDGAIGQTTCSTVTGKCDQPATTTTNSASARCP